MRSTLLFLPLFQRVRRALAVAAVLAGGAASSHAAAYSSLVIFGDSLSDTGNVSLATGGAIPGTSQPYFNGRFSNGPLWTDYLALGLGLPNDATPFLAGGNNYAFAGARTGGLVSGDVPGILAQTVGLWGSGHAATGSELFVLVGGANDLRDARSLPGATDASRQAAAQAAMSNLQLSMLVLASKGAKNVLISTVPDLGNTFEATLRGNVAESSFISNAFNSLVPGLQSFGQSLGMDVDVLDMNGILQFAKANPAALGLTNTTTPCAGFLFSPGNACSTSLFSDALHPSGLAHQYIAAAAFSALGVTPVPEPETVSLMVAGLALLVAVRRRSTRAAP